MMNMSIISLVISMIAGAVGANVVGAVLKHIELGPAGNSTAGIIGGGIGYQILAGMLGGAGGIGAATAGGLDIGTLLNQVISGAIGGAVVMAAVAVVRSVMTVKA